jgi:3-phenylpropionate/trans-cinnamate dioxygenase ferredoxin reductase component
MSGVLIVGAGLAGARCAERLRSGGYDGQIRLVGEEPVPPYRRPALSKELLAGTAGLGEIQLRPAQWWADADIELQLGRRVERLDVERRRVLLRGGSELQARTLVIATGSHAKRLPGLPQVRGVHTLRSLQDALALRRELRVGRRLVIVGAGFVGTEVASTAASLGVAVTIVDPCPPLSRVLGAEVAAVLRQRYREHGVDVRETVLDSVEANDRVRRVRLADGATLECDALLVAVGAEPAVPEGIGGSTDGIETDESGRTDFDGVYACGDAARSRHGRLGRSLRVEHWSDAAAQGIGVADAILGNEPKPRELPFFWSDQFGLRLQYVGHAPEWSGVELDGQADEFCARYFDDEGRLLAALAANRPRELGTLRRELVEALPQAA